MHQARFRPFERISDPAVFRRAFERKKSASDVALIVYGLENGLDYPRLGISASKRKIRKATGRNRAKRLLREAFRLTKGEIPPGLDLIVVPKDQGISFDQACRSLPVLARSVARRLGLQSVKVSP